MKIRPANINDIPAITRCAESFFEYAKFANDGLELDRVSFQKTVKWYLDNGIILLLINNNKVVGGISGRIVPWDFNHSIKVALEFFYWVDEEYRGIDSVKLLMQFEEVCKLQGADYVCMISVNTHLEDKVHKLYKKMGYEKVETLFRKRVS